MKQFYFYYGLDENIYNPETLCRDYFSGSFDDKFYFITYELQRFIIDEYDDEYF